MGNKQPGATTAAEADFATADLVSAVRLQGGDIFEDTTTTEVEAPPRLPIRWCSNGLFVAMADGS
eukprot:901878-Amphidinium_carterae.1